MPEPLHALLVALVEDYPRLQQLVSAEVIDEGHQCRCFGSAEDFLKSLNQQRFDLVLLDLMLPGMDGIDCLIQLKQHSPSGDSPRVVMVTALNDADRRKRALANGAEDYVLKPDLFDRLPELLLQRDRS